MRWKATTLLVIGLLIAAASQSAEITKQQVDEALKASTIHINGKLHPDRVPYYFRMQIFFERFGTHDYASRLAPVLSSSDLAVLTDYATQHAQAQKAEEAEHNSAWLTVADRAESMNAGELASALKGVASESENRQAARYRTLIAKLSPNGQTIVENFAFEHVRPQVVTDDQEQLANALPEFYKVQIIGGREALRTGQIPSMDGLKPVVTRRNGPASGSMRTESSSNSKLATNP